MIKFGDQNKAWHMGKPTHHLCLSDRDSSQQPITIRAGPHVCSTAPLFLHGLLDTHTTSVGKLIVDSIH